MKKMTQFEKDVAKREEELAKEVSLKIAACVGGRLTHNKSRPIEKMKYGVVFEEGAMSGDPVNMIVFPVDGGETDGDDWDYDYMREQMWDKVYHYFLGQRTDTSSKDYETDKKYATWATNIAMDRLMFVDTIKMEMR